MGKQTNNDAAEARNLPEAELIEMLPALDAETLAALRELEAADEAPRGAVLAAVDAAAAALAGNGSAGADAGGGGSGKGGGNAADAKGGSDSPPSGGRKTGATPAASPSKAKADETPDWQRPDYTGPLDIPQSEWRRRNIKPVARVRTK